MLFTSFGMVRLLQRTGHANRGGYSRMTSGFGGLVATGLEPLDDRTAAPLGYPTEVPNLQLAA